MAYDAQTKIIYQEVGIGDLQQCFAVILQKKTDASVKVLSGDLGSIFKGGTGEEFTDPLGVVWKVLSRVAVNKWAKHKPIKHAAFTELTPAQWVDGSVRAGEVYGIYQNSTPNDFPFDANGNYVQRPWLYDRPLFTDTQYPSRYTDFLNYYHYAPCPIQVVFQSSNNIEISTSEQDRKNTYLSCVLTFNNGISGYRTDDTCMSLDDILVQYRNYYFAIALWRKVGNNILRYFAFASETIAQALQNHPSNPTILILMCIDDFYTAVGANNFTAGDVWNCRAFLAPSQQQSISYGHLIQYADNPTDCDFKQFTVTRPDSSKKVGRITLTATLTRNGASGDEYFLSSYTITVERGTWTGTMSISYEIFGLCPTGRMMQGGAAVSGELVLDSSARSGALSIPVGSSSNSKTVNFPTASAGTFNFAQTGAGNPHIAVAGFRFTYGQESKNVAVEFDCTSNGSSYTGTRQN